MLLSFALGVVVFWAHAPWGRHVAKPMLTARGRATHDRIVSAAAELIRERGVAGTSLDDVRAATATSKSQLYHYFADKSALVRAVVDRQIHQVLQDQQPELDNLNSIDALRRWRDRIVATNRQIGSVGGCPLGRLASELTESGASARPGLVAGFTAWQGCLAAGLESMRARGELPVHSDPDVLALAVLGAVQGWPALGAGQPLYHTSGGCSRPRHRRHPGPQAWRTRRHRARCGRRKAWTTAEVQPRPGRRGAGGTRRGRSRVCVDPPSPCTTGVVGRQGMRSGSRPG